MRQIATLIRASTLSRPDWAGGLPSVRSKSEAPPTNSDPAADRNLTQQSGLTGTIRSSCSDQRGGNLCGSDQRYSPQILLKPIQKKLRQDVLVAAELTLVQGRRVWNIAGTGGANACYPSHVKGRARSPC
jgi:hypothetical protein